MCQIRHGSTFIPKPTKLANVDPLTRERCRLLKLTKQPSTDSNVPDPFTPSFVVASQLDATVRDNQTEGNAIMDIECDPFCSRLAAVFAHGIHQLLEREPNHGLGRSLPPSAVPGTRATMSGFAFVCTL